MTNISQSLYLHDGGKNQIDMEQNYVTISPRAYTTEAVFDLGESRFRFIANPDLDSLANRMVWIRGRGPVWRHCCLFMLVMLVWRHCTAKHFRFRLLIRVKTGFSGFAIRIRIRALNVRFHWIQPESRFGKSSSPQKKHCCVETWRQRWLVMTSTLVRYPLVIEYRSPVRTQSIKVIRSAYPMRSWWRGTVVERRSLVGELSRSCARPAADGGPLMWVSPTQPFILSG